MGLIDLRGRQALVTGGSRGVGAATALSLAEAGADVCVAYRTRSADADRVVEACAAKGVEAFSVAGELADAEQVTALFAEVESRFGGLDIFVGNHGIWPADDAPLSEMTDEQWHRTMDANLHSIFYTCRAAGRALRDDGRIVLVSSTAAQRGEAFHGDYASSKGAMVSLVKGLCVELAPRGITVNAVAPGWILTEMTDAVLAGEAGARVAASIPLGRIASAEDIAGPIVFLCSEMARHVTGEILNVNGGAVLAG